MTWLPPWSALRPWALILALAAACGFLTGCATIFNNGYTGLVDITSQPEGARVSIMGGLQSCQTPCRLPLPMDRDHRIEAHYPGFQDQVQVAERRVAGVFWLNALLGVGGAAGALFDWFTDSMWVLKKSQVRFDLASAPTAPPGEPPAPPPAAGYQLQTLDEPSPALPRDEPGWAEVRSRFPEDAVTQKVRESYGVLAPEERKRIVDRIYVLLVEMNAHQEPLDINEAIRRDRSSLARAPQAGGRAVP